MDLGIAGKRALVLAGGGGLGGAIAEALAKEGATVVIADIDGEAARRSQARITAIAGRASAMTWDIGNLDSLGTKIEESRSLAGGAIDILINNTGGPPPSTVSGVSPAQWRSEFEKMVLSVVSITDALLPSMKERGWGRIVTSASSGVITPIPNLGLSNSLRSSLIGWSKTLAGEVGPHGVTVNVVVPGRIATQRITRLDEAKAARENRSGEAVQAESTGSIPLRRYGNPAEYGAAVAFLASKVASYITGSVLRVDGGLVPSIY